MAKIRKREVKVDMARRQRRLDMQHLQYIEGNPLTAEEIEMFEMFEREDWSHERCRAYILAQHLIESDEQP